MISRSFALLVALIVCATSIARADLYINSSLQYVGGSSDCKYGYTEATKQTRIQCARPGTVILREWNSKDTKSGCTVDAWWSGNMNWHVNIRSFPNGPKCREDWINSNTVQINEEFNWIKLLGVPTPTPPPQAYATLDIDAAAGLQIEPACGATFRTTQVHCGASKNNSMQRVIVAEYDRNGLTFSRTCALEVTGGYVTPDHWKWNVGTPGGGCVIEWKNYHTLVVRMK